jgi:SH3 domain protein
VKRLCILALLCVSTATGAAEGKTQYITDEITATLREAPRNDAQIKANLKSGTKVTVLESLGPDSFTRVRTEDGKEGWIPTRFVSNDPAAKDRLNALQGEINQTKAHVRELETELAQAKETLAKAGPALQLADENEKLKAQMAQKDREGAELQERFSEQQAWRRNILTGAALVGGGVILGLLLPALGRRRRRGDF